MNTSLQISSDTSESSGKAKLDYLKDYTSRHFLTSVSSNGTDYNIRLYDVTQDEESGYNVVRCIWENSILKSVVKNLWEIRNYNNEYAGYLLGTIDKAEFKQIAATYARPYLDEITDEEIAFVSKVCMNSVSSNLASDELSEMINVAPSVIEKALTSNPKFLRIEETTE